MLTLHFSKLFLKQIHHYYRSLKLSLLKSLVSAKNFKNFASDCQVIIIKFPLFQSLFKLILFQKKINLLKRICSFRIVRILLNWKINTRIMCEFHSFQHA